MKIREFVSAPHMELKGIGPYPYMNENPIISGGINAVLANFGKKVGDHVFHYMLSTGKVVKDGLELTIKDIVKIPVNEDAFDLAIVHFDEDKGQIVFECCFNNKGDSDHRFLTFEDFTSFDHIEILGNEFEHPYLLTGNLSIPKQSLHYELEFPFQQNRDNIKTNGALKRLLWRVVENAEKEVAKAHRETLEKVELQMSKKVILKTNKSKELEEYLTDKLSIYSEENNGVATLSSFDEGYTIKLKELEQNEFERFIENALEEFKEYKE